MRVLTAPVVLVAGFAMTACRAERDGLPLTRYGADPVQAATISDRGIAPSDAAPPVTLRRLWTSFADFQTSSISPDGRYMSMVDYSTNNLAVRDLRNEEVHPLTDVHNEEGRPWEGAATSLFSRDGRHVVYGWGVGGDLQLRVIDFDPDGAGIPRAAEPRVIFDNAELVPYLPFDWSPDGTTVLVKVYAPDNTNRLMLVSTADGRYRTLRSFDWREPTRASFSPDGRFVAYDFPPEAGSPERDIRVLSLDGAREAEVIASHASDHLLAWQRDGSILFSSDRGGTPGIWRIAIADGRRAGQAELVKADVWRVVPLGSSPQAFYFGVSVSPIRLYTATVDPANGRLNGSPIAIEDPDAETIRGWDWSKDGKYLAYSGSIAGTRGSLIVIRSEAGGVVKNIRLDLRPTQRVRWAPDGGSIILFAYDGKSRKGFFRVDLETGSYTTIVRDDALEAPTPLGDFDISADGRTLWFATRTDDGTWALVAYDLETGTAHPITPRAWQVRGSAMAPLMGAVAVSPDGTRLAVAAPDTLTTARWIGTIPVEGGEFRALAPHPGGLRGLGWTADGQAVVFSSVSVPSADEDIRSVTWIAPIDGSTPRKLELPEHTHPRGMRLHPDGRRITFLAGESRGEVWAMEGLGQSRTAQLQDGSR